MFRVAFLVSLLLAGPLVGGCAANGPNPRKTFGDDVAEVVDHVSEAAVLPLVLPVMLAYGVLAGTVQLKEDVTAEIRSDGGGRACVPEVPACDQDASGDATDMAGKGCG